MFTPFPSAKLLIAAPDVDLRQSLAFAFEVEGLVVQTCDRWPDARSQQPWDVLVIDEAALAKGFRDDGRLAAFGPKLVLLGEPPDRRMKLAEPTVIAKPLLDSTLLDTVKTLLTMKTAGST